MHGHIILKDKLNNILVDKDNLILTAGRELLRDLFASYISATKAPSTFSKIDVKFGMSSSIPTANDTVKVLGSTTGTAVIDSIEILSGGTLGIKFTIRITQGKLQNLLEFNSLGIVINNNLISRIIFEKLPLGTQTYTLDYYLYF